MILWRKIIERVFEPLHHLHASVVTQGFELFENHGRRYYAFLRNVQRGLNGVSARGNWPQAPGCFAIVGSILYLLRH